MVFPEIYSASGMMELIQKIGFLPLLDSGIEGFSAEDIVAEDCGYVRLPEGGWDWPLWLGMVAAQYSRRSLWQGGLSMQPNSPGILSEDFRTSERNPD